VRRGKALTKIMTAGNRPQRRYKMGLKDCKVQVFNPVTNRWENHGPNSQWAQKQKEKQGRQRTAEWMNSDEGKKWVQEKKDKGDWF
jgi:hypothetical protein